MRRTASLRLAFFAIFASGNAFEVCRLNRGAHGIGAMAARDDEGL